MIDMFKKINKKNSNGFSLVEMVIAMAILSIFMPVVINLMNVSINASKTAETITSNNMNSSMISTVFEKDFKDATAAKVMNDAGTHIKLRTSNGTCKDWKVDENSHELLSKSNAEGAVTEAQEWVVVHDNASVAKSDDNSTLLPVFVYSGGTLTYNIEVGSENNNSKTINDSITSVVAQASQGKCWD